MNRGAPPVVVVAQDPGGAAAVLPVIRELARRARLPLEVLGRRHACSLFARSGITFADVDELVGSMAAEARREWIDAYVGRRGPGAVLTATSHHAGLETFFIRRARRLGIPALAVLDAWCFYRVRFLEEGERELEAAHLPDVVCVMDELARTEMIGEGFPPRILEVTGQPALDDFVQWARSTAAESAATSLRHRLLGDSGEALVAFFSQPLRQVTGPPGGPEFRGYYEDEVLELVARSLHAIGRPARVVVKPHPKEVWDRGKDEHLEELQARLSGIRLHRSAEDADELVMASDLVVGMSSIVLVKAFLAGRQVVSVQPGLAIEDPVMMSRAGWLPTVTCRDHLLPRLAECLDSRSRSPDAPDAPPSLRALQGLHDGRCAQRIADLVESMMRSHRETQ